MKNQRQSTFNMFFTNLQDLTTNLLIISFVKNYVKKPVNHKNYYKLIKPLSLC